MILPFEELRYLLIDEEAQIIGLNKTVPSEEDKIEFPLWVVGVIGAVAVIAVLGVRQRQKNNSLKTKSLS